MVVKITSIIWDTYCHMLRDVAEDEGVDIDIFTRHDFDADPSTIDRFSGSARDADVILLYHTGQQFWLDVEPLVEEMRSEGRCIISVGSEPLDFRQSTVEPEVALETYRYLTNSGPENCRRVLGFIKRECMGMDCEVLPPVDVPWYGIVHPDADRSFDDIDDYLGWYGSRDGAPWVGLVMSRSSWVTDGGDVEFDLVRRFEDAGANVILIYTMSTHNDEKGSISTAEAIERYLVDGGRCRVDAIVKLIPFLLGKGPSVDGGTVPAVEYLKGLDVPVFQPVVSSNMSKEEFERSTGLTADVPWCVAFPEFEGMIEPMLLGFTHRTVDQDRDRFSEPDRAQRLVDRVLRRIELRRRSNSEKKVVFLLNNNPCAGAEANIGGASHLDTHRSMVNIMRAMRDAGYVVDVPSDGKELIDTILQRKAMSDFRWTTVEEISSKGGIIHRMTADEYMDFFSGLPRSVRDDMVATWGEPPGQAMTLGGDILITGVSFGNVIVGVQPKRGCFGSRCDGSVCKILHDPLCPPTHQYLATYHYYEEIWGADAVIHVGTHGNLEFLPGKGVGMTGCCYPDIGIGRVPHIYIYNADNPPEGTIAKRRSHATLIDHMQTVMVGAGLYGELEELDQILLQYPSARSDPSRSHQLKHLIMEAVEKANLGSIGLDHDMDLDEIVRLCHEELSKVRDSQMNLGMHVFGEIPMGEMRAELINSIMRYDPGDGSIRDAIADCHGVRLSELYADQGRYNESFGMSNGQVISMIGDETLSVVAAVLEGTDIMDAVAGIVPDVDPSIVGRFRGFSETILDISSRMDDSLELEAFIHALGGGYTPSGPSGLITRGRHDILPTGRNFYSLDPHAVPTRASWRVGRILADNTIRRYLDDSGEMPESVAFFWMSNDLMMAGGEVMSQIMDLIGVRPVWSSNGQVHRFEIVPLEELGRPRIDVTVRSSGILRDNFGNCIDLIDSAIREVSALDEPPEMNYVRKHTLESMSLGMDGESATARVFSAPPGTYGSGVNLAVYASSWKTEEDLAEIYIAGNGYAYGNGRNGKPEHGQFANSLSKVSVTYNKIASDEHDLLGCCCYFGNQGGMTAASRHLSGRDVKAYYGDTREPNNINVHTLADEIRRVVRTKLLNPKWIEGMKEHGYKGASDIMKRVGRVYGFEATTQEVDDWIFDDIANTFVNDDEMRRFYQENNPYALEEIARRLLEAEQRGLWEADEKTLEDLRENYVEIESWMEDLAGSGNFQGGSVDIITADEVDAWNKNMSSVVEKIHGIMGRR